MTTTSSLSTKFVSFLRPKNRDKPDTSKETNNLECASGPSQLDRLPAELWSVVFTHCRGPERVHGVPAIDKFPLNLAAVCRTWRSTVNTTPELWTRIPRCHLISAGRQYLDLITLFVARSGVLPVDIHVESPFKDFSTHPIVPVLLSCADRWAVVHLSTSLATLKTIASSVKSLPELRSVRLEMWDYARTLDTQWRISTFAMSPKLREVSIAGWPGIGVNLNVDWTQIQSFSVNGGRDDHVGSALDQLGTMQKLQSLSIMGWSPGPAGTSPPDIFPCLSNLTVDDPVNLDRLSTPNIQHLCLQLKTEGTVLYADPFAQIVDLIRRSNAESKLETLDVQTRFDSRGDARVLVRLAHNLRVLRLPLFHGFVPMEDATLRASRPTSSNRQDGLPLLEELVLRDALPIVMMDGAAERLNAIGARVDILAKTGRQRLRIFELEFSNVTEAKKAQAIIGGFWSDGKSNKVDEADLKTAADWRARLIELFPELLDRSAPATRRFNPFFPANFDKLFEEMSKAEIPNMAFLLLVWLPAISLAPNTDLGATFYL